MYNTFGWQPSLLAYDLTNMSQSAPMSSMNIFMNQAMADMQARTSLYMIPAMNWNCFSSYGVPSGGMNFLLDPSYTMAQWQWNQNQCGNNFGFNGNNDFNWGNFGWNGGNTTNPVSQQPQDPVEKQWQRKYNKLNALVKQLATYNQLSSTLRNDLLDEARKTKPSSETWEQHFNNLKAVYDRVGAENVQAFLAKDAALNLSVEGTEITGTDHSKSFYDRLQGAGFEYKSSGVDEHITTLYSNIDKIKNDNANAENLSVLFSDVSSFDILDVISSCNSQNPSNRLINKIVSKYNSLTDASAKDTAKTELIINPVNRLLTKARELSNALNASSKTKMDTAINAMQTALNNLGTGKISSDFVSKFNNLYLACRHAAIEQVRREVLDNYEGIDDTVFTSDLFNADTVKDLKEEGFTEAEINAQKVTAEPLQGGTTPYAATTTEGPAAEEATSAIEEQVEEPEEQVEETEEQEPEEAGYKLTEEQKNEVKEVAKHTWKKLLGWTWGDSMKEVENDIKNKVNKYNVMYFLNEYENVREFGDDYFFEQMQSENHNDREASSKRVIKYVLDYIDDNINTINNEYDKNEIMEDREKLQEFYNSIDHDTKGKQIDEIIFRLISNFGIEKV